MAAPAVVAAGIQAGAALVGAGANYAATAAKNRRQYKYQTRAMQEQQRLNIEAWNMQNAYNSPQATMERLKAAGLNPRLIYGEGASGGGVAGSLQPAEAPVKQATQLPSGTPDLLTYYQIRQMDAQYEQTTKATDLMEKRGALLNIQEGLKNLELFKENLRSKNYSGVVETEQNMQRWLALRAEELLVNEQKKGRLMDQLQSFREKQITSQELDNVFKQHRNELAKLGIYSSDHAALRVLIQASRRMNIDLGELLLEGAENLKYLLGVE